MKLMSEKEIAKWEKQRANGKWLFILQTWFLWAGLIIFTHLYDSYFDGKFEIDYFSIVLFLFFGFIVGFSSWQWNEGKYQYCILDKKVKEGLRL